MYELIWDGKPEKVKGDILRMGYVNGGLKMIDLHNFIKSLKVCWIKRMIEADNDSILNRICIYNIRSFCGSLCLNVLSLKTIFANLHKIYF